MNIIFMGTPDFARAHLNALIEGGHSVLAVFTQPDKPKGRKKELTMPPVKELAIEKNIPVYQPESFKDGAVKPLLEQYNPDLIVVVAYGKILPEYVLDFPRYGCINVHGSLLPKYRGAAPVQRAIIDGEAVTGVTVMHMDKGLDTGDMILKSECEIGIDDDQEILFQKLEALGCNALLRAINMLKDGTAEREKQDDAASSYAHMLTSQTGEIDWSKSAKSVHDLIRGTHPWPSAYTYFNGKKLKITKSVMSDGSGSPGEVLAASVKENLKVACGTGAVTVLRLQAEGGKEMASSDYLRGHEIKLGTVLGE